MAYTIILNSGLATMENTDFTFGVFTGHKLGYLHYKPVTIAVFQVLAHRRFFESAGIVYCRGLDN
jgi:hypothetical protein